MRGFFVTDIFLGEVKGTSVWNNTKLFKGASDRKNFQGFGFGRKRLFFGTLSRVSPCISKYSRELSITLFFKFCSSAMDGLLR